MNINDLYPSDFLKASDLQGRECQVLISHVAVEKLGDDSKPVVYFQGKQKGLALNKTNGNYIAGLYGPETDGWQGRPITIFPTETDYQGKRVPCIRVKAPMGNGQTMAPQQPPAQAPVAAPPQTEGFVPEDMNDEVPF